MKFELTKKGCVQTKPMKSSDVHSPTVTLLNKPKILLNNILPAPPSVSIVKPPATRATPREFLNVTSLSTIHQNYG